MLLTTAVYASVLFFAALHHVVWRDEARALSIAITPSSLSGLIASLRDEGHPPLWYLLLRVAYRLTGTTAVLKGVSLGAAVSGMYLFARYAPYGKFEVIAWALGLLQFHEYSVLCRNCSLVLPLVFGYCAFYRSRRGHPFRSGVLLALLANTSVYGAVLAISFFCSEAYLQATRGEFRRDLKAFLCMSSLALPGIAEAVALSIPDRATLVTPIFLFRPLPMLRQLGYALLSHGGIAGDFFSLPWGLPVFMVVLVWYLFLGKKLHLSLFVFSAVIGCELVSRLVYAATQRHQGTVLVALVAAHWIASAEDARGGDRAYGSPALRRGTAYLARGVFVLLLVIQAHKGVSSAISDYQNAASSSKRLAGYVLGRPDLKDAVILAEPDYMADALPYYLNNRIFFAREGRFARWTSFTTRNRQSLTLCGLLTAARSIRQSERVPVLVVVAFDLQKPGIFQFSYGKIFSFDGQQVQEWKQATSKLGTFDGSAGDENYTLYQVIH